MYDDDNVTGYDVWEGIMNNNDAALYRIQTDSDGEPWRDDNLSNFDPANGIDDATHIRIPNASWGDYVGSDVTRSNARSLIRDYPDEFVLATGHYGFESLLLPISREIDSHILDLIVSLANDYPLYDESDHWELVDELEGRAWEDYGAYDTIREVESLALDTYEPGTADQIVEWISDNRETAETVAREVAFDGDGDAPIFEPDNAIGSGSWYGIADYYPAILAEIVRTMNTAEILALMDPNPWKCDGQTSLPF